MRSSEAGATAAAADAYQLIYGLLLSGEIEPGGRIAVDQLVRRLGVSQTPVRQALVTLEAEGLVSKTHLVGYRASELLSRKEFDDLFAVRILLEPQAAALAAEQRSDEEVVALKALQDEMTGQAVRDGALPYALFAQGDGQLHHRIAGATGNAWLEDSITRLHPHLHLFRLQYRTTVTTDALEEHAEIVEAIAAGDARAARAAMKNHLRRGQRRIERSFR
ncbi:GntR family transcriptional regulator [Streptomyces yatensis]|uniref:GntR family transcriptional regulator n=1 Tax=Streptomyces yatensis TaxID=155177 RepID=A0ABN2I3P1_9ACTN|nr:GntR family transcriptional regulator [Streptomyces yatensis]